ncbi:MAG: SDR family NAD(P)-dependent oxidoreductase [Anderseniella sp.]
MSSFHNFSIGFRAVVFGSSGGIGREMCNVLEADSACGEVAGFSRSAVPAFDLEDEASIEQAAAAMAEAGPVHLIVDATGLLHDASMQPEKSISAVGPHLIARSFAVNATGPLLLLKHFHHLMPRHERSVFATISARVGSIEDNRLGGWYGYRASKAALNMFLKTASIEIARKRPQAICLALHPGTVETPLSAPFAGDRTLLSANNAARLLLDVIDRADSNSSGSFYAYDGQEIAW